MSSIKFISGDEGGKEIKFRFSSFAAFLDTLHRQECLGSLSSIINGFSSICYSISIANVFKGFFIISTYFCPFKFPYISYKSDTP